jgi:hypothetical protein
VFIQLTVEPINEHITNSPCTYLVFARPATVVAQTARLRCSPLCCHRRLSLLHTSLGHECTEQRVGGYHLDASIA